MSVTSKDFVFEILESSQFVREERLQGFAEEMLFHEPYWIERGFLVAWRNLNPDKYVVFYRSGDEIHQFVYDPRYDPGYSEFELCKP